MAELSETVERISNLVDARALGEEALDGLDLAEVMAEINALVAQGIITRERLRAAQAYQRSMKVQLSTAIVTGI